MKQLKFLFAFIATVALASCGTVGELSGTQGKEMSEAEKRQQAKLDSIRFEIAKEAVENHRFVIVADRISGKRGYSVNVNETTNFVLVQGDKATVQFAIERGISGFNGLGGLTVEGSITKSEIKYDKKGNLNVTMFVLGSAISADIQFKLPKNSTRCDATVTSTFYGGRLVFSGELHPYGTDIYQGVTLK